MSFKIVHSNTKNAKSRVRQSQMYYLRTTHSSIILKVLFVCFLFCFVYCLFVCLFVCFFFKMSVRYLIDASNYSFAVTVACNPGHVILST